MSDPDPFIVGRRYRVLRSVHDCFSGVDEGQILIYLRRAFAHYDGMWCFNFLTLQHERVYWCIHESDTRSTWEEIFELVPDQPNQPLQATPTAVTPAAGAPGAPAAGVPEL